MPIERTVIEIFLRLLVVADCSSTAKQFCQRLSECSDVDVSSSRVEQHAEDLEKEIDQGDVNEDSLELYAECLEEEGCGDINHNEKVTGAATGIVALMSQSLLWGMRRTSEQHQCSLLDAQRDFAECRKSARTKMSYIKNAISTPFFKVCL